MRYRVMPLLILFASSACQEKQQKKQESALPASKVSHSKDTLVQQPKAPTLSRLDSIDQANTESILESDELTKAQVNLSTADSTIHLRANIRVDHRFFGYEKPNIQSKKLLLFSIFTNDVQNNPFQLKFGAYYETSGLDNKGLKLKYLRTKDDFIEAELIDSSGYSVATIYFEKKWVDIE